MNVTAADWGVLLLIVLGLFVLDLVLATRRSHAVGFREAAGVVGVLRDDGGGVRVALVGLEGRGYAASSSRATSWRKSLSADNLFGLVVIMLSFGVPREHQQRVLIFGDPAASLCLRAAFIAPGAALLELLWSGTGQACRRTGRSG